MKQVIILAALFAITLAYTDVEYQNAFTSWMQTHQKSYAAADFQGRFNIFKSNMDYVRDWNAKGSATVLGLTHLADLTNAEYQKIYLGTHFDGTQRLKEAATFVHPTVGLPASVDWRTEGAVTPIKNQGQCGSCWSFSTTGSTEGAHFLATKNLVSLSEQNLMDCSESYGNQGCNGGLMDSAFKYIKANGGIDTEASYPYKAASTFQCEYKAANSGATITGYSDVTSGSESALQTSAAAAPTSVAIDASHNSFQLYQSGVYYESACSTTALDHGVLVIGYGTSSGSDYWLVKNSWGTSWGIDGYIWMSRNRNNNCGIATMASRPSA
jgi:cathepsin L